MTKLKVLSLFDGMSCGQQALKELGIPVEYYCSEIDKYAQSVTKYQHPDTTFLGDITKIDFSKLPKIDLLIGGSPCQDFSFAGLGKGFEGDRGNLFYKYLEALKVLKPRYFLLENVKMKKEHEEVITQALGVKPVYINSKDFSAQNRQRIYWTNLNIEDYEIKDIKLSDILQSGYVDRDKAFCIDANYWKGGNTNQYLNKSRRQLVFTDFTLLDDPKVSKDGLKLLGLLDIKGHEIVRRFYDKAGKCPTLTTMGGGHREPKILEKDFVRKLTPIECERLQTVPDNYTQYGLMGDKVVLTSNTQRYKMLGNGWTVAVIKHILKRLKV